MPLTPKTTGFRFDIRLDNLSPADVVELSCPQCNHRYLIAPYQLFSRFQPSTHLNAIGERFHCKKCGWRGKHNDGTRWAIYTASPALRDMSNAPLDS
jgi:DNA-directed RNA polymerase subunit RPC12/RpoP